MSLISEDNCKISPQGEEYLGNISVSASGKLCLPWQDFDNVTLPHGDTGNGKAYCRWAKTSQYEIMFTRPWCFTHQGPELCDVPYCGKEDRQYATNTYERNSAIRFYQCNTHIRCLFLNMHTTYLYRNGVCNCFIKEWYSWKIGIAVIEKIVLYSMQIKPTPIRLLGRAVPSGWSAVRWHKALWRRLGWSSFML